MYPASTSTKVDKEGHSTATSDVVVEPYNTLMSMNGLLNASHMSIVLENASLNRICTNLLKIKQPSFADANYIISQGMSASTATMRFPGAANNSDIRKLCTNLIPFPRLHFIS